MAKRNPLDDKLLNMLGEISDALKDLNWGHEQRITMGDGPFAGKGVLECNGMILRDGLSDIAESNRDIASAIKGLANAVDVMRETINAKT